MTNYIIVTEWQSWCLLLLFIIVVIAVIALGRGYLDEVHKNYRLQRRLTNAKEEAAEWKSKYTTFFYANYGYGGDLDDDD